MESSPIRRKLQSGAVPLWQFCCSNFTFCNLHATFCLPLVRISRLLSVGFSLYFPSFPSCESLDTSFNATCATCIRSSDSTPAAPSFPVFEFDFSTIQSRYVVITVFYTYELPYRVNRDHLRASTSARYTLDGVFASTKSRNDGGCSRRCNRIYDTRLFPVASLLDETYSQI